MDGEMDDDGEAEREMDGEIDGETDDDGEAEREMDGEIDGEIDGEAEEDNEDATTLKLSSLGVVADVGVLELPATICTCVDVMDAKGFARVV